LGFTFLSGKWTLKALLFSKIALSSQYVFKILYQIKLPFATSKDYPQTSVNIIAYFD